MLKQPFLFYKKPGLKSVYSIEKFIALEAVPKYSENLI